MFSCYRRRLDAGKDRTWPLRSKNALTKLQTLSSSDGERTRSKRRIVVCCLLFLWLFPPRIGYWIRHLVLAVFHAVISPKFSVSQPAALAPWRCTLSPAPKLAGILLFLSILAAPFMPNMPRRAGSILP